MSQVDDDFDRRAQERMLLEKQRLEEAGKARTLADSKFAKLMTQGGSELSNKKERKEQVKDASGKDVIDRARAFSQKVRAKDEVQAGKELPDRRSDGKPLQERGKDSSEGARVALGRASDQNELQGAFSSRKKDIESGEERLQERKESSDTASAGQDAARGKGSLKADADGGGKQGNGGNKKDRDDQNANHAFRLNPALMAPPAVAQPRASPMSDKMRALANEIAQKIVQSVRVGFNKSGDAEFQIELKSTVLAGLQIKISGRNGRISAHFSGKDPEVMALLKKNGDGLKEALLGRGLQLVEFKIEELK